MSKPTPRPWKGAREAITDHAGNLIAENIQGERSQEEFEANAAHIVKCVNLHDELVAALKTVEYEVWEYCQLLSAGGPSKAEVERKLAYIRALLAKAEAE